MSASNNLESPPVATTSANASTTPSRGAKAKETMTLVSTALPIIGAVGTLFVWITANFYVGSVEIQPTNPYQKINIDVFDQKGQPTSFHTPHFQLMPGKYHIAVTTDNNSAHHMSTVVELGKTAILKVEDAGPKVEDASPALAPADEPVARKHWWQFWKKSN